jgi:hypothetical protein
VKSRADRASFLEGFGWCVVDSPKCGSDGYLGTETDATIHALRPSGSGFENGVPTSVVERVEKTPEARMQVLEELGYEVFDFDLWKGYLLLEESTAERFINDLLIPEFAPNLINRLKTIACGGITNAEPRFDDFLRLFVYVHTAPAYHRKAWVLVDFGAGNSVIEKLKGKFCADTLPQDRKWDASHFRTLSQRDFEIYYPERFAADVQAALGLRDNEKRKAKEELFKTVLSWVQSNRETAKTEFSQSAAEVIQILREIDTKLTPR